MLGHIDIASFDRIVVDIFQFLNHHFVGLNLLRMNAFFPELIIAFDFVCPFESLHVLQNDARFSFDQEVENATGCIRFEPLDDIGQIRCRRDQVQVVFQDDVTKEFEGIIYGEITPRIEYDVDRFGPGEDGEPAVDRAGHEVWLIGFDDAVAACCDGNGILEVMVEGESDCGWQCAEQSSAGDA